MKDFETIRTDKRFINADKGVDGGRGWFTIRGTTFFCIYSNGGGWDHVSVSLQNRCPTWNEMCVIKDFFFDENEACVEYHPAKKDYVNVHPFCLHIWKPQAKEFPTPPTLFV